MITGKCAELPDVNDNENTAIGAPRQEANASESSTDDLLHFMSVMILKAEREPETAGKSLEHAQRAFERLVDRLS